MADAFGDELFSVFEEDAAAAAAASDSKKTKGPGATAAAAGKAGKLSDGKSPASTKIPTKTKRDAETENMDITVLGKKAKLGDTTDDLNLADLMPKIKVQSVDTVEGCTHEVVMPPKKVARSTKQAHSPVAAPPLRRGRSAGLAASESLGPTQRKGPRSTAGPTTNQPRRGSQKATTTLQGLYQGLEEPSERAEQCATLSQAPCSSGDLPRAQVNSQATRKQAGAEPSTRRWRRTSMPSVECSRSDSASGSRWEPARKKKRRKRSKRKKAYHCYEESDSGESSEVSSSDGEGEGPSKDYWQASAHIPGLPTWILQRRAVPRGVMVGPNSVRRVAQAPSIPPIPATLTGNENPPGLHLPRKIRERILDGFYVDVFSLLEYGTEEGWSAYASTKDHTKHRNEGAERTFTNWMSGYTVFMGLVQSAYPDRGWHLTNHLGYVLLARVQAGDDAAIAYDEAFRKNASRDANARWDLMDRDLWIRLVLPDVRSRLERVRQDLFQRVCWDYNEGRCQRTRCKFEHACDQCLDPHPRLSCPDSTCSQ